MLFFMKIKKFLIKFSPPHLRHIKASNFNSGGIQNCARWETGDIIAVTSIQDCYFCGFSNHETSDPDISPSIVSLLSCVVLYQTGRKIYREKLV